MAAKDDIMRQFATECLTSGLLLEKDRLSTLFPPVEEASELTVLCRPGQYCASEIARAVEDCDAHLLNLNVTSVRTGDGDNIVSLRISHANGTSVARSLQRYGYDVIDISSQNEANADVMRERVKELMHYLEV